MLLGCWVLPGYSIFSQSLLNDSSSGLSSWSSLSECSCTGFSGLFQRPCFVGILYSYSQFSGSGMLWPSVSTLSLLICSWDPSLVFCVFRLVFFFFFFFVLLFLRLFSAISFSLLRSVIIIIIIIIFLDIFSIMVALFTTPYVALMVCLLPRAQSPLCFCICWVPCISDAIGGDWSL